MSGALLLVVVAVATAAAARSTWSPCGLSMLSTITPMSERGRGRRFGPTAAWFVVGAVVGGLCLGAVMALMAAGLGALHWSAPARVAVAALACAVTAASDVRLAGLSLPAHGRQVNERWLDAYRPWVYGAGFGWQIGTGLATFITTSCVYLLVVLGALTATPVLALAAGAWFGLVRGLAVFLGRRAVDPVTLRALHRRMTRLEPLFRAVAAGVAGTGALVLFLAVWWPAAVTLGVVVLAVARARVRRRGGRRVPIAAAGR